jgi:hypothetical protein
MPYYDLLMAIVATAIFTVAFLAVYKYVINPQMVITASKSQCPDRWSYNAATKKCEPQYDTHCTPFDPDAPTLATPEAKCNVAQSCGSFWPGNCP